MSRAIDIAREEAPGLDDDELKDIIWNETGFPKLWDPREGGDEDLFRRQIREAAAKRRDVSEL